MTHYSSKVILISRSYMQSFTYKIVRLWRLSSAQQADFLITGCFSFHCSSIISFSQQISGRLRAWGGARKGPWHTDMQLAAPRAGSMHRCRWPLRQAFAAHGANPTFLHIRHFADAHLQSSELGSLGFHQRWRKKKKYASTSRETNTAATGVLLRNPTHRPTFLIVS